MSVNLEDCDGLWELDEPTDVEKSAARNVFRYGSASALKQLRTNALRYLALQEGLEHHRKKNSLLVALLQLVCQFIPSPFYNLIMYFSASIGIGSMLITTGYPSPAGLLTRPQTPTLYQKLRWTPKQYKW